MNKYELAGLLSTQPPLDKMHPQEAVPLAEFLIKNGFEIDPEYVKELEGLISWGWTIIANAWSGNWDEANTEWKDAAVNWRNEFHGLLLRFTDNREEIEEPDKQLELDLKIQMEYSKKTYRDKETGETIDAWQDAVGAYNWFDQESKKFFLFEHEFFNIYEEISEPQIIDVDLTSVFINSTMKESNGN